MRSKTSRWVTASDYRAGSSTGARISTGRFGPTSPKGGFGSSVYDASKAIGRYYGYDPESYYRERFFGQSSDSSRWRYDLNKHLIGRDYHKTGRYVPSWLPRFPKKKWSTKTIRSDLQEGTEFQRGQFRYWSKKRDFSSRKRFYSTRPNICDRCRCSNRKSYKVRRGPNAYYKYYRSNRLH